MLLSNFLKSILIMFGGHPDWQTYKEDQSLIFKHSNIQTKIQNSNLIINMRVPLKPY